MTVLDYLDNSAQNFPNKTAFEDEKNKISYSGLLEAAQRIGTALARRLSCVKEPIAVLIDRNIESIGAFMGVAMSRNFYVPIDVTQPINRMAVILNQMQPAAVIATSESPSKEIADVYKGPIFSYNELLTETIDSVLLASIRKQFLDIDPLYAICTSGSTGIPKGVLICHRCVMDFISVFTKTFSYSENEIFGNQAPFDFDMSVKDIYSTIYLGATTYIIPRRCFVMPKSLVETLDNKGVTALAWAVSALCVVARMKALKHRVPGSLKTVLFGGEAMPVKMLNIWRDALPEARFVNVYGPTEITVNCMYHILDRAYAEDESIPLGKPFQNEGVLFLNEENRPIQPGEIGEICVTGTCLAIGYYRNPENTSQAFVQNPLNDRYPERMYRTGDLAKMTEEGEYIFVGRKDNQIKHMGHRIELGEIETALLGVDGVETGCCIYDHSHEKIVAIYTGNVGKAEIYSAMGMLVPKYMLPAVFIPTDALPLNHNGKIDRKRLKEDYEANSIV